MPQHRVPYYFGRLNLLIPGRDKKEALRAALASDAVLEVRGQRWGFYELREVKDGDEVFLSAYLVKYKPTDEEEIVVPESHKLSDQSIENRVTAKSRFFLSLNSGLVAFRTAGSQIPRGLFVTRFVQVLENAMGRFFMKVDFQFIEEEYKLVEELRLFSSVQRVSIYLHPSNPSSRDIWKKTDERMRQLNASGYFEKIDGDPGHGGLNVVDDEEIRQKIAMAEDGYGKVVVTGQKQGRVQTISTRDNPVSVFVLPYEDEADRLLPALREMFDELLKRFRG